MHKCYIFFAFYFLANIIFVPSLLAQSSNNNNCAVTLIVEQKLDDMVLGKTVDIPSTHSLILKPLDEIDDVDECQSYVGTNEFRMNNVQQHDQAFQSLGMGDIVTGTLNFHLPSPHGKMLYDNYHHGFRLLTVTKSGDDKPSEDYSEKYIYFRHIGLY